jgi:two-component sensor histidine kinase
MDENDSIDGAVVVFKDISERKKTEEYIQNSLNEKELLISEIHHRVKNNMQIISSLLNMQSKIIKDPAALELLKEVQNRIKAMSLIHNKLYRSKNMSSVNFKSYMLSLANELFKSYGVTNDGVSLKTDLKNISLGIDLAIPCGLIINELISNALKYAFPHERKGEIILTLHEIESGKYQLIVSDNGVGLPNDFDLKRQDSLGISIVLTLVKQINGKIEFRSNQGTSVALQF